MNRVSRASAVMAVAAVTGATVLATPVDRPAPITPANATVDLTASSRPLADWPWLPIPGSSSRSSSSSSGNDAAASAVGPQQSAVPDDIDESFIAFRNAVRNDFNEFANQLGYLGKQLAVGFNFVETIVASAVFNSTDIARGEGLLTNLGEFTHDIFLAALWVVVDEFTLNIPGAGGIPIIGLPDRGPADAPSGWFRARHVTPDDPLHVPFPPDWFDPEARAAERSLRTEEPASTADKIEVVESDADSREAEDDLEVLESDEETAELAAVESEATGVEAEAPAADTGEAEAEPKSTSRNGAGEKRTPREKRSRAA